MRRGKHHFIWDGHPNNNEITLQRVCAAVTRMTVQRNGSQEWIQSLDSQEKVVDYIAPSALREYDREASIRRRHDRQMANGDLDLSTLPPRENIRHIIGQRVVDCWQVACSGTLTKRVHDAVVRRNRREARMHEKSQESQVA